MASMNESQLNRDCNSELNQQVRLMLANPNGTTILGTAKYIDKYNNLVIYCDQKNINKLSVNNAANSKSPIYRSLVKVKINNCLIFAPELCSDINIVLGKKIIIEYEIVKYNYNYTNGWTVVANKITIA
jgi:hypothetical protein